MKTAKRWALDTQMEMSPTELLAVERTVAAALKEQREALAADIRGRSKLFFDPLVAAELVENFGQGEGE